MRAFRCLAIAVLALVAAALVPGEVLAAAPPPGPRLATITLRDADALLADEKETPPIVSVQTFGPSGAWRQALLARSLGLKGKAVVPLPFAGPRWTVDGQALVFVGGSNGQKNRIYLLGLDGRGLRPVPGTRNAANPVLSPDGRQIAFSRTRTREPKIDLKPPFHTGGGYFGVTAWVLDLVSGKSRRLTPWRNGLSNTPTSFSPDGTVLAVTRQDENRVGPKVMLTRLDGSGSAPLVERAEEAAFSPDGSRLAYVGYADSDVVETDEDENYLAGELYTVGVDGTAATRLTRTKDTLESSPSWDPSGQRIAYIEAKADASWMPGLGNLFPYGNSVMQVNPDGRCRERVLTLRKTAFYGVAWQPGPGREAGPIAC